MTSTRRLLLVHPTRMEGENRGVLVQHVETMQWLLTEERAWQVDALDPLHPAFPEAVMASDVVVVHMLPHPEIESMILLRRERRLPTVFEMGDNFLGVGDWLPRTHLLRSPLVRQRLLHHAALCDAIQVYAPGLVDLFGRVNPRITCFDPYVPLPDETPPKPGGFVVGWGGTTSHEDDLARIAPAIVGLCARHADVVFAYMGDPAMHARHFAAIPASQTVVRPFGSFDDYLAFVDGLHVGLAPARPSAFNAGRSDTKVVTYAAARVAPVLEDVAPYRAHADHAQLFTDADDLLRGLEALHDDPARTRRLAERAHEWVHEARSTDRLADQRDRFYRSLLRDEPVAATPTGPSTNADEPTYQDRWVVVAALAADDRFDEALAAIDEVAWPALYEDAIEEVRVRAGDEGRLGHIRSPLTRLRLQLRASPDRAAQLERILEEQPYDYFALTAVIRTVERGDGDRARLPELYERLCLVAPDTVPAPRRPPSLAAFLPA